MVDVSVERWAPMVRRCATRAVRSCAAPASVELDDIESELWVAWCEHLTRFGDNLDEGRLTACLHAAAKLAVQRQLSPHAATDIDVRLGGLAAATAATFVDRVGRHPSPTELEAAVVELCVTRATATGATRDAAIAQLRKRGVLAFARDAQRFLAVRPTALVDETPVASPPDTPEGDHPAIAEMLALVPEFSGDDPNISERRQAARILASPHLQWAMLAPDIRLTPMTAAASQPLVAI